MSETDATEPRALADRLVMNGIDSLSLEEIAAVAPLLRNGDMADFFRAARELAGKIEAHAAAVRAAAPTGLIDSEKLKHFVDQQNATEH